MKALFNTLAWVYLAFIVMLIVFCVSAAITLAVVSIL